MCKNSKYSNLFTTTYISTHVQGISSDLEYTALCMKLETLQGFRVSSTTASINVMRVYTAHQAKSRPLLCLGKCDALECVLENFSKQVTRCPLQHKIYPTLDVPYDLSAKCLSRPAVLIFP